LGLAEIGARMVPPNLSTLGDDGTDPNDALWSDPDWRSPPPRTFEPDPVLAFAHAPNQTADIPIGEHPRKKYKYHTNNYGLRKDTDIEIQKPAGTYRVLVLGDSQTGGYVDNADSYTSLLEDRWQARASGVKVETLNAGIIGYAPQQEYYWYLTRGRSLQPDLVVLSLYVGNDMRDMVDGEVDAALIDEEAGLIGPLKTPLAWLGLHSELARMSFTAARTVPIRGLLTALGWRTPAPPPSFEVDALVRVLRECHGCWLQTLKQAMRARQEPERFELAYRRLGTMLQLLDAHVRADGGKLAVMVIPSKPQVEPEDEGGGLRRALRLLEVPPEDAEYDDVSRERMLAAVRAANIPLIDPLTELQEAGAEDKKNARIFYRRDWHLNIRGNQVVSEILDTRLTELGLAPPGVTVP
ncbi:MAG: hypothetical protein AB7K36_30665, partial [Chloroflexota bacterium]